MKNALYDRSTLSSCWNDSLRQQLEALALLSFSSLSRCSNWCHKLSCNARCKVFTSCCFPPAAFSFNEPDKVLMRARLLPPLGSIWKFQLDTERTAIKLLEINCEVDRRKGNVEIAANKTEAPRTIRCSPCQSASETHLARVDCHSNFNSEKTQTELESISQWKIWNELKRIAVVTQQSSDSFYFVFVLLNCFQLF